MKKEEQRALITEILTSISSKKLEVKSQKVSKILSQFLNELEVPKKLIGVYAPMAKEVRWFLASELEEYNYCLPQMESDFSMKYYGCSFEEIKSIDYRDSLKENRLEALPNILLVPGLAFDKECNRLGRGKGYFDRYLKNKDIIKVGICFDEQLLRSVVTSDNDIRMNYIITENTVFKGIK